MSVVSIRAALESALAAMTPALATAYENAGYVPTPGTPYQDVAVLFARPENRENNAAHLALGFMQVTLRYPLNSGSAAAAARAEAIRIAFPRGRTVSSGGVNVTISDTAETLPAYVDGDRFAIPVRVRFFSHITA
jgi:hypothetical protein